MALDDSSDGNGALPPCPNPLHLWKQFRNPQQNDRVEEKLIRQSSNRHRQSRDNMDNSSGRSIETSRRTIVTEQVFTRQLQNHQRSRDSSYTTDSSFDSSTDRPRRYLRRDDCPNKENNDEFVNMTGILHLRTPMSTNNDNHKKYYEDRGRMEPINWNNDQSAGNPRSSNLQEKMPEIEKKPEVQKETLSSTALAKPALSDAFSNFVKNSVQPKDAYNIQGNTETNASAFDCPLYKIEQLISKKKSETITIPAAVRTSFVPSRPAFHLFNRIDTFKVLDPMRNRDPSIPSPIQEIPAPTYRHDEAHTSQHRHRHMPRENMNSRPTHISRQDEARVGPQGIPNGSSDYHQYRQDGADYVSEHRAGPNGNTGYNKYKDVLRQNENMANLASSAFNKNYFNRVSKQNGNLPVSNDVKATDQDNQQNTNQLTQTSRHNYGMKYAQNAKPAGNKEEKMVSDLWSGENCDADDDMISYVNSLSHEENVAKRESRKQALEVDDDSFGFVQIPPESSSSKVLNLPAPAAREINTCKYNFDRLQAICKEQEKPRPHKTLLAIFKKKEEPKPNKTLDSDDTVNESSDLESASVSVISTRDRFKAYRQKLFEKEALSKLSENQPILPDENDDSKVLENKNQLLNRCLRASHDYMKVHEDNVIEITNVKVGPKPEPLLKPISTRYFPKSSTDAEQLSNNEKSDLKEAELIKPSVSMSLTTEVMNSTPVEHLPEDKQEKTNAIICNTSSITTSTVKDIDSKSDLKSESNDNDESIVEVDKKDNDNDSGFRVKNINNSSIEPDMSGIKFDSATKNQQPTKSPKDDRKFETITSDSDRDDDFIDYEAFEIENIHLWFPGLNKQVENLQQIKSYGAARSNEIDYPNNINHSLESDLDGSDNNYSSGNVSLSSNLNSDSDNPLSPSSGINFDSVFEKVDIKFSELNTKGLNYNSQHSKELKSSNEETPKPTSKKLEKYRSTLKNYKNKLNTKVETKQDDPESVIQKENSHPQESRSHRQIMKEIQKHKLHLSFKKFV